MGTPTWKMRSRDVAVAACLWTTACAGATSSPAESANAESDVSADGQVGTDATADVVGDTAVSVATCAEEHPEHTAGLLRCQAGHAGGYYLYPAKHRGDVFLIDKLGRPVHTWNKSTLEPGQSCYLRENGNLVRAAMLKGASNIGGGEGGRIEEYDWDDNLVWSFDYASNAAVTHHDFKILPNGNLLMLAVERKSKEEAAAVGFDTNQLNDGYVAPDSVLEFKKTGPTSFEIVWQWHVWDHLVQGQNAALANFGQPAAHIGLLQVKGGAPAFWNHVNAIDYNPATDQIVLSARSHNELWVIDHATTTAEAAGHTGGKRGKGGDFLYRWGNPVNYGGGGSDARTLYNQHDVQWIAPGLPGAGNILVFDNGLDRPGPAGFYSTIDELTPAMNADGSFTPPVQGQAFGPTGLVWQYVADPPGDFYSSEISGAQRLPNGNTIICEGTKGHLFEVTPAGQVVWSYLNPVRTTGPMAQGEVAPLDPKGHPETAVFKGHWYPETFAGFAGRSLAPIAESIETHETACPVANANYTCGTTADCGTRGGVAASTFTCVNSGVCCFKLSPAEAGKGP